MTQVAKSMGRNLRELSKSPQAILIRRERSEPFALANARIFEDLIEFRYRVESEVAEARRA